MNIDQSKTKPNRLTKRKKKTIGSIDHLRPTRSKQYHSQYANDQQWAIHYQSNTSMFHSYSHV